MFFLLCGDGDEGEDITLAQGQLVRRLGGLHKREYLSVFDLYELWRVVYGTRAGQKIEHVPLDAKLNLPESKFSYLLQDWDPSLSVERPYAKVNATLAKILGLTQSVNSLERTHRKMSEAVSAFWSAQPVPLAEEDAVVMVCSVDGKGVPIRCQGQGSAQKNPKPASSSENEEKSGQKKASLVGAAYTMDPYIHTPEQILEALFRDCEGDSEPAPSRPKPLFKRIRASLLREAADTSKPSYEEIFGWLRKGRAVTPMDASRWWRSWTVRNRSGTGSMSTSRMSTSSKSWIGCMCAFMYGMRRICFTKRKAKPPHVSPRRPFCASYEVKWRVLSEALDGKAPIRSYPGNVGKSWKGYVGILSTTVIEWPTTSTWKPVIRSPQESSKGLVGMWLKTVWSVPACVGYLMAPRPCWAFAVSTYSGGRSHSIRKGQIDEDIVN
jgi:hypothetical protein